MALWPAANPGLAAVSRPWVAINGLNVKTILKTMVSGAAKMKNGDALE